MKKNILSGIITTAFFTAVLLFPVSPAQATAEFNGESGECYEVKEKTIRIPYPNDSDRDDGSGDGIPDNLEDMLTVEITLLDGTKKKYGNCRVDPGETDPNKVDSDGDGLKDGNETFCFDIDQPNPNLIVFPSTVIDEATGMVDCSANRRGMPRANDVDDDGTINALDIDSDGDGLYDGKGKVTGELSKNAKMFELKTDHYPPSDCVETDPYNKNTDGEGENDKDDLTPWVCGAQPAFMEACEESEIDADATSTVCTPETLEWWAVRDDDGDTIPNGVESGGDCDYTGRLDTNPYKKDTDCDGFSDKVDKCRWEPNVDVNEDGIPDNTGEAITETCYEKICNFYSQHPEEGMKQESDIDQDGLLFGEEDQDYDCNVQPGETNPFLADSDCDGIEDRYDACNDNLCEAGIKPPQPSESQFVGGIETTDAEMQCARATCNVGLDIPMRKDSDRDGITDLVEDPTNRCIQNQGLQFGIETDRYNPDSDKDGLLDGTEDSNKNGQHDAGETYPLNRDSDGDQIEDGVEDTNQDGVWDRNVESDPRNDDTDGDGLKDNQEDWNLDGVCNVVRDENNVATGDPSGEEISCAFLKDTDQDGLDDGQENCNGNRTVDDGEADPRLVDTDGDTIPDALEDVNGNCIQDLGETSPASSHSFGQSDLDYRQRMRGINVGCGCTVAGSAAPGLQALALALIGFGLMAVRKKKS